MGVVRYLSLHVVGHEGVDAGVDEKGGGVGDDVVLPVCNEVDEAVLVDNVHDARHGGLRERIFK